VKRFGHLSLAILCATIVVATAVAGVRLWGRRHAFVPVPITAHRSPPDVRLTTFQQAVLKELEREVKAGIRYEDGYNVGGDPPAEIGVCTDVVIRSFRAAGVDLRTAVAEDIRAHRNMYRVNRLDPNIDHRRCRNLAVFFKNRTHSLPVSGDAADWQPGDIVFWDTYGDGRIDHVGIVAAGRDSQGNPTVIHHWPGLPVSETDGLYRFTVKGHFRWPE